MKRQYILLLVVFMLLGPVTTGIAQQDDAPRSYYESLDFSTPTAGLQTALDAFQRYDFFTFYWTLAPGIQTEYAAAG